MLKKIENRQIAIGTGAATLSRLRKGVQNGEYAAGKTYLTAAGANIERGANPIKRRTFPGVSNQL